MCAIAGIIGLGADYEKIIGDKKARAAAMIGALKRRGPDSDGVYEGRGVLMIHTRLAVIDPENGAQPMICANRCGELVLVYNGELYNTDELRRELRSLGAEFRTSSDTEVVLRSYAEWGGECVKRFNGIFAFAVWDSARGSLFLARDRAGVKPLFFSLTNGLLYFASEIKGLFAAGIPARLGAKGVREIMLLGPARTPGCGVFEGVEEILPGECAVYDESGLRRRTYWDMCTDGGGVVTASFEQVRDRTAELVTDAVLRQTVSDVPLCTFLSGGLDSSIISSITARRFAEEGRRLNTFSVEYRDNKKYFTAGKFQPDADDEYIDEMVRFLGTEHTRVVIDTPELVDALYTATEARDLPGMADVDSSLLLFCKAVREHSTVALSGECADEIFGGYPWYRDPEIREKAGFPWSQSTAYRASLVREEYLEGCRPEEYVSSRYRRTCEKAAAEGLPPLEKRMREMMRLNTDWFMQTLLERKDRMSMYWGLEVRVPFCDHRIMEYLSRVSWEYKDWRGREKGLLRAAAESKGLLPEKVLRRKKSPYPKTHNPGYERAVRERLAEELSQTECPLLYLLKRGEIERLMYRGEHTAWFGQLMNDPQIMAYLIQVNHWLRTYRIELV